MKNFIKWLAKVSGVEAEIRYQAAREVGYSIKDFAYWFQDKPEIKIALNHCGGRLAELAHLGDKMETRREILSDITEAQVL